jgi:hypothetical protein
MESRPRGYSSYHFILWVAFKIASLICRSELIHPGGINCSTHIIISSPHPFVAYLQYDIPHYEKEQAD